jgi:ferredoxin
MKAAVNKETCIGCGLCADICPDVFEIKGPVAVAKPAKYQKITKNLVSRLLMIVRYLLYRLSDSAPSGGSQASV